MKKERTGEYVSPLMDSFIIRCEGVLCASTLEGAGLENYGGLVNDQQDIF
jgi:hypothetical protein